MKLPHGFLDDLRARTSIAQVVGRKVTWDQRKSKQAKGDWWAPCPFHQEKTASFHVDDAKGYYYCFGCHAKGDVLTFIKESEAMSFMEAVEVLAGEAGVKMPVIDAKTQAEADKYSQLLDITAKAHAFFRLELKKSTGSHARTYLEGRGLDADACERWELGFAPGGWQALFDHLSSTGISSEHIIAAGLAKPSNSGRKPYDTFRNRLIFPIRDIKGRCIAFGGRALDPEDNVKYLNSPTTLLFDKGRTLYNLARAREAAAKGAPLIVAEGYMDVISLSEAGFEAVVAPLGTAVTEHQIQLLWRMSDEPVIALDGDKSGVRAAERLVELSLPLLSAGKSLRFAMMPQGQDPDDLLRLGGASAFQECLDGAVPLINFMWSMDTQGQEYDTPERKAALERTQTQRLSLISDKVIRQHYDRALKNLRWTLFNPFVPARKKGERAARAHPKQTTKHSLLAGGSGDIETNLREALILVALALTTDLIEEFESEIDMFACATPEMSQLREAFLRFDSLEGIRTHPAVVSLLALPHIAISPAIKRAGQIDFVRACLREEAAKLSARRGIAQEISEAMNEIHDASDERLTERLRASADAINNAWLSGDDTAAVEVKIATNGHRLAQAELDRSDEVFSNAASDPGRRR